ncbi:hypothetical protein Mal48_19030 [Thalassoglobus polymorphus]|uniref:Uncharacterized protein n=1 Tax=Thalassoglobus polymorphus TaxID=2527994 RepID=A0A517QLZ5_9PLAN|nr:hypothetical protein Mal48_19030 [Thalassoglobus polymorphus]
MFALSAKVTLMTSQVAWHQAESANEIEKCSALLRAYSRTGTYFERIASYCNRFRSITHWTCDVKFRSESDIFSSVSSVRIIGNVLGDLFLVVFVAWRQTTRQVWRTDV